jgi:hypothetical protein
LQPIQRFGLQRQTVADDPTGRKKPSRPSFLSIEEEAIIVAFGRPTLQHDWPKAHLRDFINAHCTRRNLA